MQYMHVFSAMTLIITCQEEHPAVKAGCRNPAMFKMFYIKEIPLVPSISYGNMKSTHTSV